MSLTFAQLHEVNRQRCESEKPKGFGHPIPSWTPLEWAGAMAGEAGEAANAAKKIRRGDWDVPGTAAYEEGKRRMAKELGDVIIYADLCAHRLNMTLEEAVVMAFNDKSKDFHMPFRLDIEETKE